MTDQKFDLRAYEVAAERAFEPSARSGLGIAAVAVVVSVTFLLTSCGAEEESPVEDLQEEELPEEVPEDASLRVGDQLELIQQSLDISGQIDEIPVDLDFANFSGGPEVLEAFRADEIDVAWVGDTPPIHANAAGEDLIIIAAWRSSPQEYRVVTSPDSDIEGLDDLEGTSVAYAEGTNQQPVVLKTLEAAGLGVDDVDLVRLTFSELSEAVQAGEVDWAPLEEPFYSRVTNNFGAGVLEDEEAQELGTGLRYLYASREALEDPERSAALRSFVEHYLTGIHELKNEDPELWIDDYYVSNQNIPEEDGQRIMDGRGTYVFPLLDDDLIAEQQELIDVIDRAGELPAPVEAEDIYDPRFNEVIEETVAETGAAHELDGAESGENSDD